MTFKNRYKCSLNNQDLKVASKELDEPESNEERLHKIDELRNLFYSRKSNEKLDDESDEYLLRFLRARKFNLDEALDQLIKYSDFERSWPEVFDKVQNPDSVKYVMKEGEFIALNKKALDGSAVCISQLGVAENVSIDTHLACVIITLNHLLKEEQNQVYGFTLIIDRSYTTFELIQTIRPFNFKRFYNCIFKFIPIRIKSVNIVCESRFFDALISLAMLFSDPKRKKLISVYGKNFDSLYRVVDPSILPPKYGGTGFDLDVQTGNWLIALYGETDSQLIAGLNQSVVKLIL